MLCEQAPAISHLEIEWLLLREVCAGKHARPRQFRKVAGRAAFRGGVHPLAGCRSSRDDGSVPRQLFGGGGSHRTSAAGPVLCLVEMNRRRCSPLGSFFNLHSIRNLIMKRFSVLALLLAAAMGLTYAYAGQSTSVKAKSACGCVDCQCPNCNGEFCTCDVCTCGSCGCVKVAAAAPVTAKKACCAALLAAAPLKSKTKAKAASCGCEVCRCPDCNGEFCTCDVCECTGCACAK